MSRLLGEIFISSFTGSLLSVRDRIRDAFGRFITLTGFEMTISTDRELVRLKSDPGQAYKPLVIGLLRKILLPRPLLLRNLDYTYGLAYAKSTEVNKHDYT